MTSQLLKLSLKVSTAAARAGLKLLSDTVSGFQVFTFESFILVNVAIAAALHRVKKQTGKCSYE